MEVTGIGVLCKICKSANQQELLNVSDGRAENTFISTGYRNWKNAIANFAKHEKSATHMFSVSQLRHTATSDSIGTQLSKKLCSEQVTAFGVLMKIITSVRYLARQGLALRGHEHDEGNLEELLNLREAECPDLKVWRNTRYKKFTSWAIQNELLQLMAHSVVRQLCANIVKAGSFALVVDGTTDITIQEQESIVIRYVDENLVPNEVFLGFFAQSNGTTGEALTAMILDVLLRLGLPLANLRGQTYDGASSMSGKYNGTQALIARQQPLAIYVHCLMHAGNLVAQEAMEASNIIQDAASLTNDVAATCSRSTKLTTILRGLQAEKHDRASIRPLCPTRVLVRGAALKTILDQYESLCEALGEYAEVSTGDPASKARGLLKQINSGHFVLGLMMALPAIELLETLNRAVQSRSFTISGSVAAMEVTYRGLEGLRSDEAFHQVFQSCIARCDELGIEEPNLPRVHNRPKRYEHGATGSHQWVSAEEFFRVQYFKFLDSAMASLKRRYDQPGIQTYIKLESILLKPVTAVVDVEAVVEQYPEFNGNALHIQLAMLKQMIGTTEVTLQVVVSQLVGLDPVVRGLFPQVEQLVRLLLTIPCSSAEAERSFSGLRRLKTYLRNSMGHARLNHLAVLHVHQAMTDGIDLVAVARDFISKSDSRLTTFGQ
jgi:Domain of unknown function (DUF4371)/hAT family C-terminal dimerisation region